MLDNKLLKGMLYPKVQKLYFQHELIKVLWVEEHKYLQNFPN